jgi:hypothetical protein
MKAVATKDLCPATLLQTEAISPKAVYDSEPHRSAGILRDDGGTVKAAAPVSS